MSPSWPQGQQKDKNDLKKILIRQKYSYKFEKKKLKQKTKLNVFKKKN